MSMSFVHYFFEWAGLAVGLFVYRAIRRRKGEPGLTAPGSFPVVVAGLLGAAIGNKVTFWAEDPGLWANKASILEALLAGQSIVGALMGGWIGIECGKRIAGVQGRTGDDYVLPILSGLMVGRIGCFLAGLEDGTCGIPTTLPWGVDFGDGVPRHPAQLYECFLALPALLTWSHWRKRFAHTPGLAFRVFMLAYLLWRVGVDMIKPVPYEYIFGLSGIQLICIVGAGSIVCGLIWDGRKKYE